MIAPLGLVGVSGPAGMFPSCMGRTDGAIKQMPLTIAGFVLFFPGPTFLFSYLPLREASDKKTISIEVDTNDKRRVNVL